MSDAANHSYGGLVPTGGRELSPVVIANPLVSRGLADLVERSLRDRVRGYYEQARSCLKVGDLNGAIRFYDEIIQLRPNSSFAYLSRAEALLRNGNYEKAICDCDQAIRIEPEYQSAYSKRGDAWLAKKDYDRALQDYDEVIRISSEDLLAEPDLMREYFDHYAAEYLDRGLAWESKGNFDRAIQDYGEAIRLDPSNDASYHHRGRAKMCTGDYDEAILDFTEAIRLNPHRAMAYYWRGRMWAKLDDYETAIKDFEEAIRLDPDDHYAYSGYAWVLATCPDEKVRDGKLAIHFATKACELTEWERGSVLDTLAAAYAEAGQFDEAERYQRKALEDSELRELSEAYLQRLKLYQRRKPYRTRP